MRERSTEEYKKAVLRKLLSTDLSDRQFAIEEGIAFSTLHQWKSKYHLDTVNEKPEPASSDRWSPEAKFSVVLETASLSEIEIGEYCRRKGIYPEQLELWKQACIQGNMKSTEHKKQIETAVKSDKKRIKELERELARKDKALAEAAALLLLQKKLDALWNKSEDV